MSPSDPRYTVARNKEGKIIWWSNLDLPYFYADRWRLATKEEGELMTLVVAEGGGPEDRERLLELLAWNGVEG
jgi:hypothetical protein